MKRAILAIAVLAAATSAQADNRRGWYIGGGPGYIDTGVNSGDGGSIGFSAIELYGGYKLNPFVGGELRLGTGLAGDNATVINLSDNSMVNVDYSITHAISGYYRVESANQVAKIYGLVGFSSIGLDAEATGVDASDTPLGFSYGAGIGFVVGPKGNLNFEYRALLRTDDYEFDILSINYDFRF